MLLANPSSHQPRLLVSNRGAHCVQDRMTKKLIDCATLILLEDLCLDHAPLSAIVIAPHDARREGARYPGLAP